MSMRCWSCSTLGCNGKYATKFVQKFFKKEDNQSPLVRTTIKLNVKKYNVRFLIGFVRIVVGVSNRLLCTRYEHQAYWKNGEFIDQLLFAFQEEELCFMGGGESVRSHGIKREQIFCERAYCLSYTLSIKRSKTGFLYLKNKGIFTLFRDTEIFQNPFLVILHHYAYVLYTKYWNTTVLAW
jgi:hypothetical protein